MFGAEDPAAAVREIAAAAAVRPGHTRGTCRTDWYGQPYRRSSRRSHTVAVGPRVLIVDDHPSFRASARVLLEAEGFDVVGEAADGAQAITEAGRLRPEVVLLDVQLPDIDGFDVAARLTGADDAPTVILVSSRDGSDFGPLVTRSGARGFVPKAELSGRPGPGAPAMSNVAEGAERACSQAGRARNPARGASGRRNLILIRPTPDDPISCRGRR